MLPGRKGLHLLVTFVNIKDIKALFIYNHTGHNNKRFITSIYYQIFHSESTYLLA